MHIGTDFQTCMCTYMHHMYVCLIKKEGGARSVVPRDPVALARLTNE